MLKESAQAPALVTAEKMTGTVASQLSVAVTVASPGIESHSTVILVGTPESTGAVVSTTVRVCVATIVFKETSVEDQMRSMLNESAQAPRFVTAEKSTVTVGSQLSVAVTVASPGIELHSTVMLVGTPESTGAEVSVIVIVAVSKSSSA